MPDPSYYIPFMRVKPASLHLVLDGLATLTFVCLAILALVRLLRHRRLAAEMAHAESEGERPPRPGETVLSGRVDGGENEGPAVTVEIEQEGREWKNKGAWHHSWKETRRQVTSRPFYVVRKNGEQVRVEPDAGVLLVDKLDSTQRPAHTRRLRSSTLVAGESVHIIGTLTRAADPRQGGYREAGTGWVLRPPRTGRMLISTEPLADRHKKRVGVYSGLLVGLVLSLFTAHGLLFASYNHLRMSGQVITARSQYVNTYRKWVSTKHGGYWQHYYEVYAAWDTPGKSVNFHDFISPAFYQQLLVEGPGAEVPFVIVRGDPSVYRVGVVPTDAQWKVITLFIAWIIWLIVFPVVAVSTLPWYDKKRVTEGGSGRL